MMTEPPQDRNAGLRTVPPSAGPLWFRKMDRNGDGDISRREFPGTDAVFQQLDSDGDGLISAAEAERLSHPDGKR